MAKDPIWEGDIDAALNWVKILPTEGAEALDDRAQELPIFRQQDIAAK